MRCCWTRVVQLIKKNGRNIKIFHVGGGGTDRNLPPKVQWACLYAGIVQDGHWGVYGLEIDRVRGVVVEY